MGRPKKIVQVIANDANLTEEEMLKISEEAELIDTPEEEQDVDIDNQPSFMQTTEEEIVSGIEIKKEIIESNASKVDFKNFKYLKMNIDYKPDYKSGWLTKGECYLIDDIGIGVAVKLIESNSADWLENKPEKLAARPTGRVYKSESAETQVSLLEKLKNEALKRQGKI